MKNKLSLDLKKGGSAMENTLEKGKGIKADLKNPNMLNDDALDQVTGGISALESAIKVFPGLRTYSLPPKKTAHPGRKMPAQTNNIQMIQTE